MTYHSRRMTDRQIKAQVVRVEGQSFFSKRDDCRLVRVRCSECGRMFEEELEAAKAKLVSQVRFICLDCYTDADAPGLNRVTVQLGWFLD